MSLYLRYTCDACGAKEEEIPERGYFSSSLPTGWKRIDGRELCSLPCVAAYANDPKSVPAMAWRPDPFVESFKRAMPRVGAVALDDGAVRDESH